MPPAQERGVQRGGESIGGFERDRGPGRGLREGGACAWWGGRGTGGEGTGEIGTGGESLTLSATYI
jgi:hypothetical protein